ncbi:MAG: hypothetical protein K2Q19_02115 [Rhodocyclaceae bacterium]|nr:hypothetical protein [Rhodocyclaceae bacterium]
MTSTPEIQTSDALWRKLAELYAPVASIDQTMMESAVMMSDLNLRLEGALSRKQQLAAEAPTPPSLYDASAVDALVDDPSTDIDESAMRAAAEAKARFDADSHVWQAKMGMVDQAIAKLDAATVVASSDHARMREGRDAVWSEFCHKARELLCAEFERRFLELRSEILDPIDYLDRLTDSGGNAIIKSTWMRPDVADVKVTKYKPATYLPEGVDDDGRGPHEGGKRWITEYLYPAQEVRAGGQQRAEFYKKVAAQFFAGLQAGGAPLTSGTIETVDKILGRGAHG